MLVLVAFTFWAAPAHAQDVFSWVASHPAQQLAADPTVIPVGQGAIFVPTITGAEHEPPATVVAGDEVHSISVGSRALFPPGPYVVVVSSGSPAQGVSVAIEVVEGETTVVPVQWGAVRIEVVDDHRVPHRGAYEIIRADTRQPVGTGFGADTLQGEILQTWLLAPGLYRIVRVGRSVRALRDYVTVYIPEGGFVRYRVVQDADTGDFLGGGVLLPEEIADDGRNTRWFRSVVVGFDGAVASNRNVVGAFNQTQYTANGFIDAQAAFADGPHRVTLVAQADEGFSQVRPQDADPQPLIRGTDRLRGDALYTWAIRGALGPYVRGSAQSRAFASEVLATEDTTFVTTLLDGSTASDSVLANETFRIAAPWEPTLFRQGVGLNTVFLEKARSMNFNFRLGLGSRQNLYDGALVLDDTASTSEVEYKAIPSFNEVGFESTVVATMRLPGWVVYATDVELFAPFTAVEDGLRQTLAASWRNTLSLRLTRNLSMNYFVNIDLEPQVIDSAQVEQSVLLRASWELF